VYGEFSVPGGRAQKYERGRISWSSATGAHETVGPIATRYLSAGAEGGALGYPVTGTVFVGGGSANRFQHGRISSQPSLGTFLLLGAVAARFAAAGGEGGALGFPVSDLIHVEGGTAAAFQHGRIAAATGGAAYLVRDVLAEAYDRSGDEGGPLGFPLAEEVPAGGGRVQRFAHGRISWSPANGAHWLSRKIAEKYEELGAESSSLGWPIADEVETDVFAWKSGANPTTRTVAFEHGAIVHHVLTGQVVVVQT
jgi:uncharacterized protein with LGFP repeats